jgi:integrase
LAKDQAGNRSAAEVARLMEREVLSAWGDRPISSITRRDCRDLIDGMAERAPTYARRLHAHLHRLFRWLRGRDVVAVNPMADLPRPGREVSRDRVLTDDELAEVWSAAGEIGYPFGPAVRLLILTAARRDEIAVATWAEIDADAKALRLEGARTKTGQPRLIPLSAPAWEIVAALPQVVATKGAPAWLFSTNGTTPASGWSKAKARIDTKIAEARRKAGIEADMPAWRVHDLRRSVATGMQRLGERLEIVETVLGHTSGSRAGVVGVYQRHRFETEARAALEAWGRHVLAITGEAPAADVIDLRGRR